MNADDMLFTDNGEQPRFCGCAELLIGEGRNRKRLPIMKFHSCEYVRARNELIPQACKRANEIVREHLTPEDDTQSRAVRFTRQFSIEMDRLAAPLLRNGAG